MENNNSNELLQTIGQLYVDAKRLQFIIQQRENLLAQNNKEMGKLKAQLAEFTEDNKQDESPPDK